MEYGTPDHPVARSKCLNVVIVRKKLTTKEILSGTCKSGGLSRVISQFGANMCYNVTPRDPCLPRTVLVILTCLVNLQT